MLTATLVRRVAHRESPGTGAGLAEPPKPCQFYLVDHRNASRMRFASVFYQGQPAVVASREGGYALVAPAAELGSATDFRALVSAANRS